MFRDAVTRSVRVALVTTMVAIGASAPTPAVAQDGPQSFSDMAKAVQTRVLSLKSAPDGTNAPFPFGHFLKPPPPPKTEEEAAEAPVVLPPEIKCQGVMQMGGSMVVVINSATYRRGEKVMGATITNITPTEVTFNFRNRLFKLPAR